jgi:uncharacterized OB-fold protein
MLGVIVSKFYDNLKHGKITGCKCKKCGNFEFPPKAICSVCGSFDLEWAEISGKGKLLFLTATNRGRGAWQNKYLLGTIKLDEGPLVIGKVIFDGFDFCKLESVWEFNGRNIDVVAEIDKNPEGVESVVFRILNKQKA